MRFIIVLALASLVGASLSGPTQAERATVAAPQGGRANYDPTLSAKEAVLANWDLAASGIRAGRVVGGRVVAQADRGLPFRRLARLADRAQKTMVQRWNAAQWVYSGEPDLARLDRDVLRRVAAATAAPCEAEPCLAEAEALRDAFADATEQLDAAAAATRGVVEARMARGDADLMREQLALIADYLEGSSWSRNLTLSEFGRDTEVVAARLVGALALWRNIEPYVGLVSPEIDDAINAEARQLLRTLRLKTRRTGALDPEGAEMDALRERATALAAEFRRAAALFAV